MKSFKKNDTRKYFVLIYMFPLYCATAQAPAKAGIGFRIAKHLCMDLEKFVTTKQIQAPPSDATEYVPNDPCREVAWKKCPTITDPECMKFTLKSCKIDSNGARIVGGIEANPNEFPHQARLWFPIVRAQCGGVVLNENYILTAAHCIRDTNWPSVQVILGDHDVNTTEASKQTLMVSGVVVHEGYDNVTEVNDIALAKLTGKIQFNSFVKPALMPPHCYNYTGKFIVTGWGKTRNLLSQPLSRKLLKAEVDYVPLSEQKYHNNREGIVIAKTSLCAAALGKDACQGDSGGPLVVRADNGSYILAGIISVGLGCGNPRFPGVYTRVSRYLDWISSNAV